MTVWKFTVIIYLEQALYQMLNKEVFEFVTEILLKMLGIQYLQERINFEA